MGIGVVHGAHRDVDLYFDDFLLQYQCKYGLFVLFCISSKYSFHHLSYQRRRVKSQLYLDSCVYWQRFSLVFIQSCNTLQQNITDVLWNLLRPFGKGGVFLILMGNLPFLAITKARATSAHSRPVKVSTNAHCCTLWKQNFTFHWKCYCCGIG